MAQGETLSNKLVRAGRP
ncbi:hypothetical protein POG14_23920 [Clostridium paraputrificum]|nr:hypothetical protein [Clostridium paraputrificum]